MDRTIDTYVEAFCSAPMTRAAVNDLSRHLTAAIVAKLQEELGEAATIETQNRAFAGRHCLDASVFSEPDGLRLGVDVKGLNSPASARKNWINRIGDIQHLAASHHATYPLAVLGAVLVIPLEGIPVDNIGRLAIAFSELVGYEPGARYPRVLDVGALIVISKTERKVVNLLAAPADNPLSLERFIPRMITIYRQRWLRT